MTENEKVSDEEELEVFLRLLMRFIHFEVIITSRDAAVGNGAAKVLQGGGLNVFVHRLDIVDLSSVESVHLNGYDNTTVVHISWYVVNSMVYLVSSFSFYFCHLQCYAVWYMLNLWN